MPQERKGKERHNAGKAQEGKQTKTQVRKGRGQGNLMQNKSNRNLAGVLKGNSKRLFGDQV